MTEYLSHPVDYSVNIRSFEKSITIGIEEVESQLAFLLTEIQFSHFDLPLRLLLAPNMRRSRVRDEFKYL